MVPELITSAVPPELIPELLPAMVPEFLHGGTQDRINAGEGNCGDGAGVDNVGRRLAVNAVDVRPRWSREFSTVPQDRIKYRRRSQP